MRRYVGITIGPIVDTIMEASSPAALWFASSLFSDITKRLCQEITREDRLEEVEIYSPYYAEDISQRDGVGKFHDRIIFSVSDRTEEENVRKILLELISRVKRETVQKLPKEVVSDETEKFLEQYLQIQFVILKEEMIGNENCILVLSPYLDCMELMKTFPEDNSLNPIKRLFFGEENNSNRYIKESPLFQDIEKESNQFFYREAGGGGNKIRSLGEISSDNGRVPVEFKRCSYYAVVQADGDGLSRFLHGLQGNQDKLRRFSEACLKYDEEASRLITQYGGMTIYAGGDDLLFLAPVMNAEGEDIFSLCKRIHLCFREQVSATGEFKEQEDVIPTISAGISIQYYKFPLYEALASARELLEEAKQGGKNCQVASVQKHSGQKIKLLVPNEEVEGLKELLHTKVAGELEMTSVIFTLRNSKILLEVLDREARNGKISYEKYEVAWLNLFDSPEQKDFVGYLKRICSYYYNRLLCGEGMRKIIDRISEEKLDTLTDILWLRKFLEER